MSWPVTTFELVKYEFVLEQIIIFIQNKYSGSQSVVRGQQTVRK